MIALGLGLLLQAIWPASFAGWGIGGMIALVSFALGMGLVWSGRSLRRSGTRAAKSVRDQAIYALAAHRSGILTARDLSLAIGISAEEADLALTKMTQAGDDVTLEVDDEGRLTYRFGRILPKQRWPEGERARVVAPGAPLEATVDAAEDSAAAERRRMR
jgi:hypothetical protein